MEKPSSRLSRDFLLLWQGQLVSQLGSQLSLVPLVLWLRQTTDSASLIGFLAMAATVPAVLLGPLGGAIADRYSRRAVLIGGDLVRASLMCLIALSIWLAPGVTGVTALFVACVVGSAISAVWTPAAGSLVPELVARERLASANSMLQGSMQLTVIVGQSLGGILFKIAGVPLVALFDAITFLYGALSIGLMKARAPAPARPPSPSGRWAALSVEIREGIGFIWRRPGLRALILTAAVLQLFVVPTSVLFPFYVELELRAGPEWYGFLLAGSSLGSIVGYVVAGVTRLTGSIGGWLGGGALLSVALLLGSLGLVSSPWTALCIVVAIGTASGFVSVKQTTALQLATPPQLRGRVFSLLATMGGALAPLGMALAGVVADLTGRQIGPIYLVCGAAVALIMMNIILRRDCRAFLAGEPPSAASGEGLDELARSSA